MSKFAEAVRLSYEDWASTLPELEDIPEPEYSKQHIKRMNKLFDQMRGDKYHRFTSKTVKVMLVAAVIMALMLTAFAIPSSREALLENFDIFGMYELTEHNNNSVTDEISVGYIPEGFEMVSQESYTKHVANFYTDSNNQSFFINKRASSAQIKFNTEDGNIEEIVIDNITYLYSTNASNMSSVIWTKNDYIYQVRGDISKEELLKIAQEVK